MPPKGFKYPPEHQHWNKGIDNRVEMICESCGKTFKIYQSQVGRHHKGRYCSRQCYFDACTHWAERTQVMKLRELGKGWKEIAEVMGISPVNVTGMVRRENIRGGQGLPSVGIRRLRTVLREDYGIDSCELCEFDRAVQIAHIVEVIKGGRYSPDNCLLLCPNCHYLFDHNSLTSEEATKLLNINRLNGNLKGRLEKCLIPEIS